MYFLVASVSTTIFIAPATAWMVSGSSTLPPRAALVMKSRHASSASGIVRPHAASCSHFLSATALVNSGQPPVLNLASHLCQVRLLIEYFLQMSSSFKVALSRMALARSFGVGCFPPRLFTT
jgi:hypothetical protein